MGLKEIVQYTLFVTFIIILSVFSRALIFQDDTQSEFDQGTYFNTEWLTDHIRLTPGQTSGTYTSKVFDAASEAYWNNLTWTGNTSHASTLMLTSAMHTGTNRTEVFTLDNNYYLADMKDSSKVFYLNFSETLKNQTILKLYARQEKGVAIGIFALSDASGNSPFGTFTVTSATGEWYNVTLNINNPTNAIWLGEGTGSGTDPKDYFDYIYAETVGTNISFQVKNCSLSDCTDSSFVITDLDNISLQSRYFQYRASFSGSPTPELSSVSIEYTLLNQPPSIISLSLTPVAPNTTNDLVCSFIITDPDKDSLSANITWYKDDIQYSSTTQAVTNGTPSTSILDSSNTAKAENWNCTITPFDGNNYGAKDSRKVTVQNTPPTKPDIAILPIAPYTNHDLNVAFNQTSTDADGDSITYSYYWYKNGIYQPSLATSSVSSGLTTKNEVWTVNITPSDGTAFGEKDTDTKTIANTIPSITSATSSPSIAYKTTPITASAIGWQDADEEPENYLYQWFNQLGKIAGATSATLATSYFNKSDEIFCNVTPYDSDSYGQSKLTNSITIQNSLPTLAVSLAAQLGFNGTDEDLTGSFIYSDADGDPKTNNQTKWYKDNVEQTALAGTTIVSSSLTAADEKWIFSARANDGQSWSNWFNSSPLTILDISQTFPVLVTPKNNTFFNTSTVILTYTTPNYENMNCTIYLDKSQNPTAKIKTNSNINGRTTIIYSLSLNDSTYYWKVGCTNDSVIFNSTTKSFTIDTTIPTSAPNLTQALDDDKDGNIELQWAVDPDAAKYNIYRSSQKITDASGLIKIAQTTLTQWEDNTSLHNSYYWYAITTVDGANNENKTIVSNSLNATANDTIIPALTNNVTASSLNGLTTIFWTRVNLDVSANSDYFSLKYKLWYIQNSSLNLSKNLVNQTASFITSISQESCTETCTATHALTGASLYYYFITTIDDAGNENLTINNNYANVTATLSPPGSPGGGGGSGGGGGGGSSAISTKEYCKEDWSCSAWYSCINDVQARTCVDVNACGTENNRPEEKRKCSACEEDWQCGDWTPCINNQRTRVCFDKNDCKTEKDKPVQTEECSLDSCSDKIKNFGEAGVDCGGPCRPCKASDFITGGAIALSSDKGPNRALLIPTILLLMAFIFIKAIRKEDTGYKKIVSALHTPMIILITAMFIFSFFGPKITGFFVAGNETQVIEEPKVEQIQPVAKNDYQPIKAKIAAAIFLLLISITTATLLIRKSAKKKIDPQRIKELLKRKSVKDEEIPIIKDLEIEINTKKPREEPFKSINKGEIIADLKNAFKIEK